MKQDEKLVSIACRVYNSAANIAQAIESVLHQSYTNWELIIVDDNSQDSSQDIIMQYQDSRIKYYRNEHNIGIIANLNKAFSLCSGSYITILDGDDVFYPDKLKLQVDFLNNNPDYGAVFSYLDFSYNKKSLKLKNILEKLINTPAGSREEMLRKIFDKENFLAFPSEMFRREFLKHLPDSIIATGDCNFHVHILLNSKIKVLEFPLVKYSIKGDSNTSSWVSEDIVSCENIYLLNHFAQMKDINLFKSIFNGKYEQYGTPTVTKDIPYFVARMALDTHHRRFSGLYLLQTIFEDSDYFSYIMNKFHLSYKDYIDLRLSTKKVKKRKFGICYFREKRTTQYIKRVYFYIFREKRTAQYIKRVYFYIFKQYVYKEKIVYKLGSLKLKTTYLKQ